MEVFGELRGHDATVIGVFDSYLEQIDVVAGVSQNSDDIFDVSFRSCFYDNVEGDCEETEQHFGLALVPRGEGKGCCCAMRFCIVLYSSGSQCE